MPAKALVIISAIGTALYYARVFCRAVENAREEIDREMNGRVVSEQSNRIYHEDTRPQDPDA